MKPIIIYYSKTGFTQQYAKWLSEALSCPCVPFENRDQVSFDEYDTILFGSWWHAGSIQKLKWFQSKYPEWPGKKLLVFAVGAMPMDSPSIPAAIANNFTPKERERISVHYLPGGLRYAKMNLPSRLMMKMFSSMMAKKKDKTPTEQEMAEALAHSYDLSDPKYIRPVLDDLQ